MSDKATTIANSTLGKFFLETVGLQLFLGLLLVADGAGFVPGASTGDVGFWIGIGLLISVSITTVTDLVKTKMSQSQSGE